MRVIDEQRGESNESDASSMKKYPLRFVAIDYRERRGISCACRQEMGFIGSRPEKYVTAFSMRLSRHH